MSPTQNPLTYQELVLRMQTFWAAQGCVLQQPYDVEVGAGTMAPETFLRVLGPKPYRVGYVQPSRRPADGRYGENPNRLFKHMQFQVILKPPPQNVQELYLQSLEAIGIDLRKHDIKFEEDNWESPTLGAWGIGWQVMLDGLERIAAFLQDVDSIYDITWVVDADGRAVKYGEIRLQDELQFSVYNFERADVQKAWKHLELYEAECQALLEQYAATFQRPERRAPVVGAGEERRATSGERRSTSGIERRVNHEPRDGDSGERRKANGEERSRFPVLAAFDLCLKCSHLFNILDARGAISVTERVGVIARIRALAVGVAKAYVDQQKAEGEHPTLSRKAGDTGGAPEPEQLAASR